MANIKKYFNKEYLCIGLTLFIAFVLFWFLFPLYSYDSEWYLTYVEHFIGNAPLSSWNSVRGFSFPLILWIAHIIKAGPWGIELILCFFYMLFGLYLFKIVKLTKKHVLNKGIGFFDCFIVFLLALMSSVLWGYFHLVLTECFGVSLGTIYLYYAIRFFINRKCKTSTRGEHIGFLVLSCIMTIFLWFLKQSFIASTILVAAMFELLIWFDKPTIKRIIYSLILAASLIFSLKCSINIWNVAIGNEADNEVNNTKNILNRINHLRYIVPEDIYHGGKISVMDDNWEVIDSFEYNYDDTYWDVIKYWGHCFVKYPKRVLIGYLDSYFCMAEVFQDKADGTMGIVHEQGPVVRNHIWETISGEYKETNIAAECLQLIRPKLLNGYDNKSDLTTDIKMLDERGYKTSILEKHFVAYSPNFVTKFLGGKVWWTFTIMIYAILLLAAPVACIICFAKYIRSKEIMLGIYTTGSFYSFLFVLMHVIEARPIDRYAVPAYSTMLVIFIVSFSLLVEKTKQYLKKSKNVKKKENPDEMNVPPRVLVIVPAYNEAESISGVIDKLSADSHDKIDYIVDYVVINDCSKDNTLNVLQEKSAHYINLPINLGIGGGVQTGYKYALYGNYDIAVQIDGDGQHDTTYLDPVIRPIINREADIVIGSRFINREGFQSSRTRRLGINFLSTLIWVCCGARVSDVTSGFRAVSRKYIELYAQEYPVDYPEPEAIVRASLDGAKITEIPVVMRNRESGTSSITPWKSLYYMIKVSLAIIICRLSNKKMGG